MKDFPNIFPKSFYTVYDIWMVQFKEGRKVKTLEDKY